MTKEELLLIIEKEIDLASNHIRRNDNAVFYEGKISGLTWLREQLRFLTPRAADASPVAGEAQQSNKGLRR